MNEFEERKTVVTNRNDDELPTLIGESEAMRGLRRLIDQVAPIDVPVLIIGESGTGKEVVARMIHDRSNRRREAFVPVNCGAIPEGLFESELFGAVRGAYTGSERNRAGLFEQAQRGTLLLDEIGDMPLAMQVKLLRVLETGIVTRLGGSDPQHVDFRLISSTNRNLDQATADDKFRLDLYYRIRAVQLEIPALRDRPEDVPALIRHFSAQFVKRNRISTVEWSPTALHWLSEQRWEGNVRELRWFVEGFLSLDHATGTITLERVQPLFAQLVPTSKRLPVLVSRLEPMEPPPLFSDSPLLRELHELKREIRELKGMVATAMLRQEEAKPLVPVSEKTMQIFQTVQEREREAVREALDSVQGNRREAARKLGISERTLYRKLRQLED